MVIGEIQAHLSTWTLPLSVFHISYNMNYLLMMGLIFFFCLVLVCVYFVCVCVKEREYIYIYVSHSEAGLKQTMQSQYGLELSILLLLCLKY